jgi:hypothetical protein
MYNFLLNVILHLRANKNLKDIIVYKDWIDVAQDRDHWRFLVNTAMNLRVPYNVGKFLSSCTTGGFSRRTQLYAVSFS